MGDANRVVEEVHGMLDEVNYKTIKKALYNLSSRGFVDYIHSDDHTALAITNLGKKRIEEILPTYKTDRPWDGHIYLVSYDIPTKACGSTPIIRRRY